MEFRKNDPGAVQFGNFINYYQFHSAEDRLKLMPPVADVWLPPATPPTVETVSPYLLLDVGCNTGDFTQLLWTYLSAHTSRPVHILGVDIDALLIERAQEQNEHPEHITFVSGDVMAAGDAFQLQVAAFLDEHQRRQFDAVCCFSITMWIHLNHHDRGLQRFLRQLAGLAELFVVEPQPWNCYRTAKKRLKNSGEEFPLFAQLQWRLQVEQQIQDYLEEELGRRKVYECSPSKWKRRICFYR